MKKVIFGFGVLLSLIALVFWLLSEQVTAPAETQPVQEATFDSLAGTSWQWVDSTSDTDEVILPRGAEPFTIRFNEDNQVLISTDCNDVLATYQQTDEELVFDLTNSSWARCSFESQQDQFILLLGNNQGYFLNTANELELYPADSSVTSIFVPADVTVATPDTVYTEQYAEILGMTEEELISFAEVEELVVRVDSRNGESFPLTTDYVPGRVTVSITNGTVSGYSVE